MNQSPPTNTTARIEALNEKLRDCKPYAAFVAICASYGHRWADDSDIERFEAAAGLVCHQPIRAEELDAVNSSPRASWMFCATALMDGRLQMVPAVIEEPAVEPSPEPPQDDFVYDPHGGYYADEDVPHEEEMG